MRKRLIVALAAGALAGCGQESSPEPIASETAAVPATASASPSGSADAATAAAAADATPTTPPGSGYDWAESHNIENAKDCTVGDQDFREGCALYVQEKDVEEGEREFEGDGE